MALVLAYFAIHQRWVIPPVTPPATQEIIALTTIPTREQTKAPDHTPTPLPAIPPTPNEETPTSLGVSSGDLRGVTVMLWQPWTGAQGAAFEAILVEFNRINRWGVSVQSIGYEGFGRLDEAVETALSSDTLPDVIVDYGYMARHLDTYDALVDLTHYLNDPVWGWTNEEQSDFLPIYWEEDLVNQGSSGLSRRLAIPDYRSAYLLFYNQSLAHDLGFQNPPATPDDFRMQACTAAVTYAEDGDQAKVGRGGWLVTSQPGALLGWVHAFGGEVTNSEKTGYSFNTPEIRQAFTYLKDLQTGGCAWLESEADPQAEFSNRGALFFAGSLFDIHAQQEAFNLAASRDEWTVIPFPSKRKPAIDTYGPSIMVTRSTPSRQLAAWLVLDWLVYPPNQAEWVGVLETFPTSTNSLTYLNSAASANSQWAKALDLLPDSHSEPSLVSWGVMRWSLQDAMFQLFDPKFEPDQISALLENLDNLGSEITTQVR